MSDAEPLHKENLTPNFDHLRLVVEHAGQADETAVFSRLQQECRSCRNLLPDLHTFARPCPPANNLPELLVHPSTDETVDYVLKSPELWNDPRRLILMMFHFCHCTECLVGLIDTRKLAEGAPELPDDVVYVLDSYRP